jgi:LPPG:FO 2-phospho-L-lactate transferase
MKVTVLAGGVGGARFTRGLRHLLAQRLPDGSGGTTAEITVVVNTGDDMWLHGVRVCPDLDTVMYTLGGAVHEDQGWGRRDESSRTSGDLAAYDLGWEWFTLGDLDLATHLARTELLRAGQPLSRVTAQLCRRWQPGARLLPMTDQEVETHVVVDDGHGGERLVHFEEWWVRHHATLPALRFELVGLVGSAPAPGVLEAITQADVVVLPPSNPVVSVGTILAIPGVREALASTPAPVVGVSPIIGGAPVRGMADACLRAIGVETSAVAVAQHYGARASGGLLDGWLMDGADAHDVEALVADGFRAAATDTLMVDVPTTARIAADALGLVGVSLS